MKQFNERLVVDSTDREGVLSCGWGTEENPISGTNVESPPSELTIHESTEQEDASGKRFLYGDLILHDREGGSGHREALHVEHRATGATSGEMCVALQTVSRVSN